MATIFKLERPLRNIVTTFYADRIVTLIQDNAYQHGFGARFVERTEFRL